MWFGQGIAFDIFSDAQMCRQISCRNIGRTYKYTKTIREGFYTTVVTIWIYKEKEVKHTQDKIRLSVWPGVEHGICAY